MGAAWAGAPPQGRAVRCEGLMARSGSKAPASEVAPVPPGGSPMALKGKVAVVTGAAGAMGRNIARALLSAGATVVLGDRDLANAEAVAKDFQGFATGGAKVVASYVDVTDEVSVAELFAKLSKEHGSCDILVNSAGIMFPPTPTEDLPAASFSKLMAVNVTGGFICSKEAFKIMKKQKSGRIINVGSIAAISPRPDAVAYTVSKFAISGLTQSLALDGRPHNIAVGVVHPGNVLSDLITPAEVAQRKANGEDFMDPMVVANAVLHMCSLPPNSTCLEVVLMPTVQPLIGRG